MKPGDRKEREASAQLRRVMTLIPIVGDGERHSIADVAETLDVDEATVLRDLETFGERFDTPGGFVEGLQIFIDGGHVAARSDQFLRPMRLTRAELQGLDFALALLRAERPPSEWRAIDDARSRLQRAVALLPDDAIGANSYEVAASDPPPPALAALRDAIARKRKARIVYHRADRAEGEARIIHPCRLMLFGPTWYVAAFCDQSDDARVFRLDRIESVQVLDDAAVPSNLARVEERIANGFSFAADAVVRLRIRFRPTAARWVREHEAGVAQDDGSYVVEYPLADPEWAVRHVLQYGTEAEVLEPAEVREMLAVRLRAMRQGARQPGET